MQLFGPLYARILVLARAPGAIYYLCGLSLVEAFIFPIPPEAMLAPMMLGKRHNAFHYANASLLFALLGALLGYALGHWAFQALRPLLATLHLLGPIEQGVASLGRRIVEHRWGTFGVLILAALQPVVPLKFVTWACGILAVPVLPFLACIALGRGKRVWLLALLIRVFGERAERILHTYIEWIGWSVLVLLALLLGWLWLR